MKLTPQEFENWVMEDSENPSGVVYPHAEHDHDGDYFRVIFRADEYYAKRMDGLVTVYISEESGEP